ncbi:MAG: hypothetical protein IJ735_06510 [Clostridia bacterium]|nr:hypothetical protein [Clostridia bacterium]
MFGNNTLPLLLLLLLSNGSSDDSDCGTNDGCCDKNTLAMCLCLLCLLD